MVGVWYFSWIMIIQIQRDEVGTWTSPDLMSHTTRFLAHESSQYLTPTLLDVLHSIWFHVFSAHIIGYYSLLTFVEISILIYRRNKLACCFVFDKYCQGVWRNLHNTNIIATGVWQSKDELRVLRKVDRVFEPRGHVYEEYDSIFTLWSQALDRFLNWYDI